MVAVCVGLVAPDFVNAALRTCWNGPKQQKEVTMTTLRVRNILYWFTKTTRAIGTGIAAALMVERLS